MKLSYISFLSLQNLKARKLRTFLTIGGMSIGVGAIVFLVSLGFGLQRIIVDQVTDVAAISTLDVTTGTSALLSMDADTIDGFEQLENVIGVSASASHFGQAVLGDSVTDVGLFGIDSEHAELEGVSPIFGAVFGADDTNTIVLSDTTAELLGHANAGDILQETVTITILLSEDDTTETQGDVAAEELVFEDKEIQMEVIGVVDDELSIAYMPFAVLEGLGIDNVNLVRVKVNTRENLEGVRDTITAQGFQVDSVADTIGQIDQIFTAFQLIMAGFGLIAMFVASIGAFNTLTVSLLERTREVGVMKSLGVTRRYIYILFMAESFLIAMFGGFTGLFIGYAAGELMNFLINNLARQYGGQEVDVFLIPIEFLLIVIGIVFVIGFITGIYPARRAAHINPLDALRYE